MFSIFPEKNILLESIFWERAHSHQLLVPHAAVLRHCCQVQRWGTKTNIHMVLRVYYVNLLCYAFVWLAMLYHLLDCIVIPNTYVWFIMLCLFPVFIIIPTSVIVTSGFLQSWFKAFYTYFWFAILYLSLLCLLLLLSILILDMLCLCPV